LETKIWVLFEIQEPFSNKDQEKEKEKKNSRNCTAAHVGFPPLFMNQASTEAGQTRKLLLLDGSECGLEARPAKQNSKSGRILCLYETKDGLSASIR
jgi:hypothetical protein